MNIISGTDKNVIKTIQIKELDLIPKLIFIC